MTDQVTGSSAPPLPFVNAGLFIGGRWTEARSGETFDVIAPATEQVLTTLPAAGAADVDAAVAAARAQVDGGAWSKLTGAERGVLLNRLADLIERDLEVFVTLEALDVGRPAYEPRVMDLPLTVDVYRHFAGWADKISGSAVIPEPRFGGARLAYTLRQPLGVVGAIIPWNAPTMITAWKLAPALAAGNAVVLKPAEDASLTALHLAALAEEAGLPGGVLNVVTGAGVVAGAAMVGHAGIDKISFTGSTEVGRQISVECARRFRPVTLELGGKSPQIVLADADLESAIGGISMTFLANQGEVCAAGTRIFVARAVYDEVVEGVGAFARNVRVGDPFHPDTTMGALINAKQRDVVNGYIQTGQEEGARVVAGGGIHEGPGYFVQPTVFADGTNDLRIAREEIFGPVGLIMPFDDVADALTAANDNPYALAAYVWTKDITAAHTLASGLDSASVWINGSGPPDARVPWGGNKESGIGRELGQSGILANTKEKSVTINL
jgi:acyl-CoA reductase-like NAD-dependent aldehyde dehydrogenase